MSTIGTVKKCTDCKHFSKSVKKSSDIYFESACLHPKNASLVDGTPNAHPVYLRYQGECGKDGLMWEEKT
jgi:hypothetical protein